MIARARKVLGSLILASALAAPRAEAQTPTDAELRRVVSSFRESSPAATLSAITPTMLVRLNRPDRAIAEMYRGFALVRMRRQSEGEAALQRAAGLDPSVLPDPQLAGQDLVDSYRVARARMPIVGSFTMSPLEFIPQLDSVTRLEYQIEGGRILRRTRAQLRLMLARPGGDTVAIWRGNEGDTTATWNGRIGGQLAAPGDYTYLLEARGPDVPVSSYSARPVRFTHAPVDSGRLLAMPTPPQVLPESSIFMVEDRDRKAALRKRGLTLGIAGAVMAGVSAALVQTAIDHSAPKSGMRYAVAGTYIAGLTTIAAGTAVALYSRSKRFRSEVAFPNNDNIRLNRELRQAYEAELQRVRQYNQRLEEAVIFRQTFLDGAAR